MRAYRVGHALRILGRDGVIGVQEAHEIGRDLLKPRVSRCGKPGVALTNETHTRVPKRARDIARYIRRAVIYDDYLVRR